MDVHPELGTLADMDRLIAEARDRGIDVWLDLVPNHTSNQHQWFDERPEYYVWSEEMPNDWSRSSPARRPGSTTSGAELLPASVRPEQPDLDWSSPEVRLEFERILRYWFDRGVGGFRIDVAHALVKDSELRDGEEHMRDRPEVLEIFARWQEIAAEYDPKPKLIGET